MLTRAQLAVDVRRRQPRCFVSHAHADHIARHELALATPATAAIYRHRLGPRYRVLEMNYREPIEFGGLRLTAYPAGHILGSAMLLAEDGEASLLYTGDFKLGPSVTAEPAELPHADVLVMECTFGRPRYQLPPRDESIAALLGIVRTALAAGRTPVVHAYPLGKAQEVTKLLTDAGIPVLQHPTIYATSLIYQQFGVDLGDVAQFPPSPIGRGQGEGIDGRAVVTLPRSAAGFRLPGLDKTRHRNDHGHRLGDGPEHKVPPGRESCDSAFRPCRLRATDRGRASRRAAGNLLHPRHRRVRRSPVRPGLQCPPAQSAGPAPVVFSLVPLPVAGEGHTAALCRPTLNDESEKVTRLFQHTFFLLTGLLQNANSIPIGR